MVESPAVASLAMWLGQWLRGTTSPDELFDAVAQLAPDAPALILTESGPQPLAHLLATLTSWRADAAWIVLPRPGGPGPLPVSAGHAAQPLILVTARRRPCLVITHERAAWSLSEAAQAAHAARPVAGQVDPVLRLEAAALAPRSARRCLLELLAEGAARLSALGLDRPADRDPGTRWAAAMAVLPSGIDGDAVAVLRRAAMVLDVLDLALSEEGSAVTAKEATQRRRELRSLSDSLQDLVAAVVNGQAAVALAPSQGQVAGTRAAQARRP